MIFSDWGDSQKSFSYNFSLIPFTCPYNSLRFPRFHAISRILLIFCIFLNCPSILSNVCSNVLCICFQIPCNCSRIRQKFTYFHFSTWISMNSNKFILNNIATASVALTMGTVRRSIIVETRFSTNFFQCFLASISLYHTCTMHYGRR